MKIISGGQTGADQAGWRAAKAFGVETGGWMPMGFLTEAGPRPEFAKLYGATENNSSDYRARTIRNVCHSHCTFWFDWHGDMRSPGFLCTRRAARDAGKDFRVFRCKGFMVPESIATLLVRQNTAILNIAGNRESRAPGIGAFVEQFMREVLLSLYYEPAR